MRFPTPKTFSALLPSAVLCTLAVLASLGCATIVDGTTQELTFGSEPEGAQVVLDGQVLGFTPLTVEIDRAEGRTVELRKAGYASEQIALTTDLNPTFWGNILTGGLLGSTTDSASGASVRYAPDAYETQLTPEGPLAPESYEIDESARRWEVKRFVLLAHGHLLRDVAQGRGEYLEALLRMLGTDEAGRPATLGTLRRLLRADASLPQIAGRVADLRRSG